MNIAKVIKFYFYFTMTLVMVASLSFQDDVKNFIVSAFHVDGAVNTSETNSSYYVAGFIINSEIGRIFDSNNQNPNLLNFSIVNNPENSFAEPGSKDVPVMDFVFKTGGQKAIVKSLKLKIVGVESENVENAVLKSKDEVIKSGHLSDDYLFFENINYQISGNSEVVFSLYVDLSPDLKTGQRIRMDIENPKDIALLVGGKLYSINKYYPIKGKYLSIAKPRPGSGKEEE